MTVMLSFDPRVRASVTSLRRAALYHWMPGPVAAWMEVGMQKNVVGSGSKNLAGQGMHTMDAPGPGPSTFLLGYTNVAIASGACREAWE